MDTLHTVMRSIRGETKTRRDHLTVFREFLDHLDRVTRARGTRGGASRTYKNSGKVRTSRRSGKG